MLSALLRRERMLVLAALLAVILLAWSYLLLGAGVEMEQMDMGGGQMMLMAPAWTASYAALIFLMWAIMMMAMMLPSAAPAVLLAAALMRQRGGDRIFGPTGLFVLGYLLIWFGFSLGDCPGIGGIMPLWQGPARHRKNVQIADRARSRACHYRLRNELGAADRRRFATTASVGICSCAG
jgi:hypothetical protein